MLKRMTLAALASLMLVPALAQGHVTLQPDEAPAGGFTRLDVRVPNEEADAKTTKVSVQMPDGFAFASYEPVPGWTVDVKREKLPEPIETDDGKITEQVSQITWTADEQGAIPPGAFQDFGLSVGVPDEAPGTALTFKALQTYDNGEVVRWIGAPDSDKPAPQVTLTAAEEDHHSAATDDEGDEESGTTESADDDSDSNGLGIAALIIAILGLGAGGTALVRTRGKAA